MELKWIGCPTGNLEHAIDPKTNVCVTCGEEAVEYDEQDQERLRLINELAAPPVSNVGGDNG